MLKPWLILLALSIGMLSTACATEDIPQAYKGRYFSRTGPLALYTGGHGLTGPVLGPGTYFTKTYNELRTVDCSTMTKREPLEALTKDGVQFGLTVYVRFSANCSDPAVMRLLSTLTPDQGHAITWQKLYDTYVQPAMGEAVREVVSPYRAADLNDRREQIIADIRKRFIDIVTAEKEAIIVSDVSLSNLDFPDEMDKANTERAVQAILRDKAIAERERVTAEIETMRMRRELSQREGEADAAKIDAIGAALRRNPEYLQFDLQSKMPEIYQLAGAQGNLVIAAPSPSLLVSNGQRGPGTRAPPLSLGTPAQAATTQRTGAQRSAQPARGVSSFQPDESPNPYDAGTTP